MKKLIRKLKNIVSDIFWHPEESIDFRGMPKNEELFTEENINASLEPIRSFMEEFIGIPIIEFSTFVESISDLHEAVSAKFIVKTEIIGQDLWLKLYDINGKDGGYLKMSPSLSGEFIEVETDNNVLPATMYRLEFYGEDTIDYVDVKKEGRLSFEREMK